MIGNVFEKLLFEKTNLKGFWPHCVCWYHWCWVSHCTVLHDWPFTSISSFIFPSREKVIKSFWRQPRIRLGNLWYRTLRWFSDWFFEKQIVWHLSINALWCKYVWQNSTKNRRTLSVSKRFSNLTRIVVKVNESLQIDVCDQLWKIV